MSPYILCKISNFKSSLLRDHLVHFAHILRNISLCYAISIISTDFLAGRLENDELMLMRQNMKTKTRLYIQVERNALQRKYFEMKFVDVSGPYFLKSSLLSRFAGKPAESQSYPHFLISFSNPCYHGKYASLIRTCKHFVERKTSSTQSHFTFVWLLSFCTHCGPLF